MGSAGRVDDAGKPAVSEAPSLERQVQAAHASHDPVAALLELAERHRIRVAAEQLALWVEQYLGVPEPTRDGEDTRH